MSADSAVWADHRLKLKEKIETWINIGTSSSEKKISKLKLAIVPIIGESLDLISKSLVKRIEELLTRVENEDPSWYNTTGNSK